jgi:hypothetical protein
MTPEIAKLERRLARAQVAALIGFLLLAAMLVVVLVIGELILVLFAVIFATPVIMFGLGTATSARRELEDALARPQLPVARIVQR